MAYDVSKQIEEGQAAANAAEASAEGYLQSAATATQVYQVTPPPEKVILVGAIPGPVVAPTAADLLGVGDGASANQTAVAAWMDNQVDLWLAKYFPPIDVLLAAAEDAWLLDVINNGYLGIPDAVANQIWGRARDAELAEANRLAEEAVGAFAQRGFSMPPGALAARTLSVQMTAADKLSSFARDQAIKTLELSIDMVKMAIQEATRLRTSLAGAMSSFMQTAMNVPMDALKMEILKADIKNKVWAAANDYSRTALEIEKLRVGAHSDELNAWVSMANVGTNAESTRMGLQVNAAVNSAQAMAHIAASARSANNTLVGAVESIASKG